MARKRLVAVEMVEMKSSEPEPETFKFMVWFTGALSRFRGLKAHHMAAVQTYFVKNLKLPQQSAQSVYDAGLVQFGFKVKGE